MKKLNVFGKWLLSVAERLLSVAEVRLLSVANRLLSVAEVLFLAAMMCAPFTASAQVTIGSGALPQATLDIIGAAGEIGKAFRLDDGNQADGKVLTVDGDNAVATWQYPALTILSSRDPQPATAKSVVIKDYAGSTNNVFIDTDDYIDLEPGKYMILTYMPVWINFSLAASEVLSYRIALVKAGATTVGGVTISVRGPYRGSNDNSGLNRQITMYTLDTSSNATTTRYYVGYGGFYYYDANGTIVTTTHANAASNGVSFIRSGMGGFVYAIPMTQ